MILLKRVPADYGRGPKRWFVVAGKWGQYHGLDPSVPLRAAWRHPILTWRYLTFRSYITPPLTWREPTDPFAPETQDEHASQVARKQG